MACSRPKTNEIQAEIAGDQGSILAALNAYEQQQLIVFIQAEVRALLRRQTGGSMLDARLYQHGQLRQQL
ncbi:MAG: hypothetical protein ACLFVO_06700 [Chloroflexaceae bacterium]